MAPMTHAWFDLSAGVAGDMLLGALLDAGADLGAVQAAVDAVAPGSIEVTADQVVRGGQRATKARVGVRTADVPHRHWSDLRAELAAAPLPPATRDRAIAVFSLLADAEGRVHGTSPEDVHFHEVGALDSIADVVGSCEALRSLGVTSVSASAITLGSGRVTTDHGRLPVPVPAVVELMPGWRAAASPTPGETGELATPTGVALVRALASACEGLPPLAVTGVGVGAGDKDFPGHPNVVRVVLGDPVSASPAGSVVEQRANVDDLDPRLWPGVLDACLAAGALDAWLTPVLMKKGRPGHTLHTLVVPEASAGVAEVILTHTTTLGVRESAVARHVLDRSFVTLDVAGEPVVVKVGSRDGRILHAAAEFESLAAASARTGRPESEFAQLASAAIVAAGLVPGAAQRST